MAKRDVLKEEDKVNLTPMIDVVFLLLVYFMVTTSLIKQEADMGIKLPADAPPTEEPLVIPEEYFISIGADGMVYLDDAPIDGPNDHLMLQLKANLMRLRLTAEAIPDGEIMVTISPEDEARHERVIDVLNACAFAKIKKVTFAGAGE